MKNLRWKVFTVIGVFVVFFALGVYPILANRYGAAGPAVAQGQGSSSSASTSRAACTSCCASIPTRR